VVDEKKTEVKVIINELQAKEKLQKLQTDAETLNAKIQQEMVMLNRMEGAMMLLNKELEDAGIKAFQPRIIKPGEK